MNESQMREWELFCIEQAKGFDAFTELQRSGIAGCFEINGKSFIEKLFSQYKAELLPNIELWFLRLHNEPELWTVKQALEDIKKKII